MKDQMDFQITEEGDSFIFKYGDADVVLTKERNPYNMYELYYLKRSDLQPKPFKKKRYLSFNDFLKEYIGLLEKEEFIERNKPRKITLNPKKK